MNNNLENRKMNRWVIIAITYAVCYLITWIAFQVESRSGAVMGTSAMVISLFYFVMGLPLAGRAVISLYNSVLGGVMLFGPISMFLWIFLIKLVARVFIAAFAGPFIAPYTIGNFVAAKLGAE